MLPNSAGGLLRIEDIIPFTILEPTLIVPLINRGNLQGIIVLGERIIKEPYHGDEEDFLLNIAGLASIAIDNAFLFEVSTTDMMTRLKLRHVLFQTLKTSFKSNIAPICVLMVDLDHFKNLNDTYGHAFGDIVLKKVASVLIESLRLEDLAARYGGEEFTIILKNMNKDDSLSIADRIRKRVESLEFEYTEEGKNEIVKTTISIGIAKYDSSLDFVPEDLIKRADAALYRAKEGGRNRVEMY